MEGKVPFVDHSKCIGSAACNATAPKTFKLNPAINKSDVINPQGDSEDKIQDAIDGCPVQAILWKKKQ